jgi:hypothetical protein
LIGSKIRIRKYVSSADIMEFDELSKLNPSDLAKFIDSMITAAIKRTDFRMARYRAASTGVRILAMLLAGGATIILGVSNLPPPANIAFSFTAIITLVNSLEPFFSLRSTWVIQEEALSAFRTLHEELRFEIASSSGGQVDDHRLHEIFQRYEGVWATASSAWAGERRSASRDR